MSLENNIILNLYSIAVLLIICFHALKFFEKDFLSDKLYMIILYVTAFMLGVDILSRFDGNASNIYILFNHIGNFLIFLMCPVLPSLWVAYVHFQVFLDKKRTRRLLYPLCIINIIYAIIIIISQKYGWIYYIDSNNVYHRGPFFLFPALVTILLMFAAFILIIGYLRNLGERSFFTLIFFAVPPFIGIILQIAIYGISFILNGVVLSLLVVFINIQNNSMYTDYLTGVSNRKKLDAYLKKKVSLSTSEKTFSAILMDMNNFKYINDTYGHNIGDNALETAANLINSCIRSSDFIARYGGDEFCIVLDISNENDLEKLVFKLENCLEKYNMTGSHIYKLEFSMGYAVYNHRLHKGAEGFLKQLDMLMYENKQAYKNRNNS